ncbi:MAG: PEP-CTERM sorting domain-containing protein [Opitutaceae bacterium]
MTHSNHKLRFFVAALVTLSLAGTVNAATIVVDLTTAGQTGTDLDNGTSLPDLPFSVAVAEAIGVSEVPGLQIQMVSGSSFDSANTTVNGAGSSFGLNAPTPSGGTENATRFDVDAEETLTISFNQPITLISVKLTSFSGTETFSVGGVSFGDADASGTNVYTFTGGGLSIAANTGIELFAGGGAGSSVGMQNLTIETVPEPSASGLLLGLGALGFVARRGRR